MSHMTRKPSTTNLIRAKVLPMVVTVNIPDELAAQAKARGLSLEALVQEILTQELAVRRVETGQPRTSEEIRAWLDSLAQFSDKIPPLPETLSREWIYTQ
jgi:post-segregation antitoxin (ccd killing protein)